MTAGSSPSRKFRVGGVERRARDADARRAELPEGMPFAPECPFCGGSETEVMNAFGSHASVSTYWCRPCGSPFEMMRWRGGGAGR